MNDEALIILSPIALFIFLFGFIPESHASGGTISNGSSCASIGGTWDDGSNTCSVLNLHVGPSDVLTIPKGVTLSNNGAIRNDGGIRNEGGTIRNYGSTIITNAHFIHNLNGGTIDNGGAITNNLHSTINNEHGATINNNGKLSNGGVLNNRMGAINNYGTINNDGSWGIEGIINNELGIINNLSAIDSFDGAIIKNNYGSTINNSGNIRNRSSAIIFNFSIIANPGAINNNYGATIFNSGSITNSGAIINYGGINNSCGAMITGNPVFGNQPIDKCDTGNALTLFEGGSPTDGIIDLNQEIRAVANAGDPNVDAVTFKWIDPHGTVVREVTMPVASAADDRFAPNLAGMWTVEAHFADGMTLVKSIGVSFMVLPESPIGAVVIIGSSLGVLGVFMKVRRHGEH